MGKSKEDAKRDHSFEKSVAEWIEAVTNTSQGDLEFADWLRDGQILCQLMNCIRPGTIRKIHVSQMPFKQMENITSFVNAARDLGVPESATFSTPDLYEQKNIGSVARCVYALGGVVQANCPEFTGPKLGVAMNTRSIDKKRSSGLLTDQSAGFSTAMDSLRTVRLLMRS